MHRPRPTEQRRLGSKRLCQEKVVCSGAKAELECKQCGTKQCRNCENVLHKKSKFASHDRTKIEQPAFPNGVQPCQMWCNPINSADFSCSECKCLLCAECNRDFHKGKLTRHYRKPIPKPEVCIDIESEDQIHNTGLALLSPSEEEFGIPGGNISTGLRHRTQTSEPRSLSSASSSPPSFDDFHSIPVPTTGPTAGLPQLGSPPAFEPPDNSFLRSLSSENSGDYITLTGAYKTSLETNSPPSLGQLEPLDEDIDRFQSPETDALELDFQSGHFSSVNSEDLYGPSLQSGKTSDTVLRKRKEGSFSSQQSYQGTTYPEASSSSPLLATPVSSVGAKDSKLPLNPPRSQTISRQPVMAHVHGETKSKRKPVAKIQGSPSQSLTVSSTEEDLLLHVDSDPLRKGRKEAMVRGTHREGPPSSNASLEPRDFGKMTLDSVDLSSMSHAQGFLMVDEQEVLQIANVQEFLNKLNCSEDTPVKVVSIFGNTGDGKSHTLNHAFYGGQEVFSTSALQESCTIGIWAAMDTKNNIITVDTEGLLGVSPNENQRTRLLLKVLAISDVVIYRTRADRLHRDLFQFLGDASKAYLGHFTPELKAVSARTNIPLDSMGPSVIVFHETTHTLPLGEGHFTPELKAVSARTNIPLDSMGPSVIVFNETTHTLPLGEERRYSSGGTVKAADTLLQERFKEHGFSMAAFSCVQYIGTQTPAPPTDFSKLQRAVKDIIDNSSVRAARPLSIIYQALVVLNEKFSGDIDKSIPSTFPDEYFTCSVRCMSCKERCSKTMNHTKDDVQHLIDPSKRCQYQHQFDNKVFICKTCYERGDEVVVVPKASPAADGSWFGLVTYAWSGYVLECKNCGIIYRSRQHWYGNLDPEITAVRTEIRHVWPGGQTVLQGTHNAARKLVDGISYVADTVTWVGAKPTKMVTQWMTDQIAPPYWRPNSQISNCHRCRKHFDTTKQIHHCRACGEGFCDDCSEKTAPVPERGWGDGPVRVCDDCYKKRQDIGKLQIQGSFEELDEDGKPVTARKVGEAVQTTFSVLGSAVGYPLGLMVDAARPAYWIPDSEITNCCACDVEFIPKIRKHHCRACGHGVCNECSQHRRVVPSRGWDEQVRVCDNCNKKKESL